TFSFEECYNFMTNEVPFGQPWEAGGNLGVDTSIKVKGHCIDMLEFRPDIHCAHVGPSGGGMCEDRDYREVVYNSPYNESLVGTQPLCDPNGMASNSSRLQEYGSPDSHAPENNSQADCDEGRGEV
ncbi:hypothetical protein MPER_07347, partial [Moniliophthora perniciosa FA553]